MCWTSSQSRTSPAVWDFRRAPFQQVPGTVTDRKRRVLAGVTQGLTNRAAAFRRGVSGKISLTTLRVPDKKQAAEFARHRGTQPIDGGAGRRRRTDQV